MSEQEGVIKFNLEFFTQEINDNLFDLTKINHWRQICLNKGWIGQVAGRYRGLGFGNISTRILGTDEFIITGTQTGSLKVLDVSHLSHVYAYSVKNNQVKALGLLAPSSESMTHAVLYKKDKNIQAIVHIHAPDIWNNTNALGLPYTNKDVPYGTVQMAKAVENLLDTYNFNSKGIFSMLGHEDGVIVFGNSLEQAGQILLDVI